MTDNTFITLAKVILRTSASWDSVNRMSGLPDSYQNRSHLRRFLNWMPMTQAKVGPTRPPCSGVSASPPAGTHPFIASAVGGAESYPKLDIGRLP